MALYERLDPTTNPFRLLLSQNGHGSGHRDRDGLIIIDWSEERDHADELVEGFAMAGRWTAIAAAAKAGKSSLLISMSVEISEGRDPFDGTPIEPLRVLYVDAEMGRLDMEERLVECGYEPPKLRNWWACDIPPRLDTTAGAALVVDFVRAHQIQMVVIDGINGTVGGAEKDDSPWRLLFEHTIRALKAIGVAVVTADNLGKDSTLGPRGSSVKMDKADAVLHLTRTANGVNLHASHRRTAAYPLDTALVVYGLEGDEPVHYRRALGAVHPDGTKEFAELLDELGIDPEATKRAVRSTLRRLAAEAGDRQRYKVRDTTLVAAIRWRKEARKGSGTTFGRVPARTSGTKPDPEGHQAPDQGEPVWVPREPGSGASLGTGGGVVDTPVPNAVPSQQVDPNDVLI